MIYFNSGPRPPIHRPSCCFVFGSVATCTPFMTAVNLYNFYVWLDPDAPTPEHPKYREWRHWLVMNIPGNDISRGETCVSYVGAAPPKGSKPHRYVILGEFQ